MAERISIQGACDLHIHTGPDVFDRLADDVEMAEICRDAGLRAIGYKHHVESTQGRAWHTMRQVPGIRVLGGLVLNNHVGGINPAAVDGVLKNGASIIWMPSYHSLKHLQVMGSLGGYGYQGGEKTPYDMEPVTIFDDAGEITKETIQILELIRKYNAIIATSHLSAEEGIALCRAAREIGVKKVLITHPFFMVPEYSLEQLKTAVSYGGTVEFCASAVLNPVPKAIPFHWYVDAIREIGADHIVIGSDCGQARKTYPPETIRMFAQTLAYQGISASDIQKMLVSNYDPLLDGLAGSF